MDTETIDRLFLELSQFTTAKTKREIKLRELNAELLAALKTANLIISRNLERFQAQDGFERLISKAEKLK